MARRRTKNLGTNIAALAIAAFVALPLYWMVASAFKGEGDITSSDAVPPHPTTANFGNAFHNYSFGTYLMNSAIVAVATTIIVLSLGTFAGYALARLPMRGKTAIKIGRAHV